ncbi:PHP domain-containing protein [Bacillus sp. Marseille-P3800]|uniref:PHP domain-containing protein n=1 Tax=Bacillus sp. Marseille-P3800 TaxID=2014782 RepID=UPI000C072068|nr:PHP domain-containing protein [Bacillus sp. Marseille-P3800]
MCKKCSGVNSAKVLSTHNHTSYSNIRLLDATTDVAELIQTSANLGHAGIAITDHECVSAHVKAIQIAREKKKAGKIPQDFKLILGNEIYLVDSIEEVRDFYTSKVTKFPHFLLLSKDEKGHEQLRRLSSLAWQNSFYTGLMERVPTEKEVLRRIVKEDPGHLIATSACLGSESSIHLLGIKEAEAENDIEKANRHKRKLKEFIEWCIDTFGKDDFYIELQPALSEEQIFVNKKLVPLAEHYGLKCTIASDTHYLRPEDQIVHKALLNAKEGDREVDDFYASTYLHTTEEIKEKMDYLPVEIINNAMCNTLEIGEKVKEYTIEHETVIPKIELPEFTIRHIFKPGYSKYKYIEKMANSKDEQDRYMVSLLEDGFDQYIPRNTLTKERFHEILARIDVELGELYEISKVLNQTMSSYYITVREIVNIIWDDECGAGSLLGSSRGSAAGFLINMLLGITQVNPLDYGIEMPHWRHLHRTRPDVEALDVDLDTEGGKRPQIIRALKNHFGENKFLQVCTYGVEKSKSAIQLAARGLGIDSDDSQYISSLIPFERGENWTLKDCLYGNEEKGRKPIKEFKTEIEKHPQLKEIAMKLEGIVTKRSIHAGGVIVFNEDYYKSNAMMTAPNGNPVTQFNLDDSQAVGNIKFDLLTVEALDKIRASIDTLVEYGEMEWQGNIRSTFEKYLHPKNIDLEDKKLYEMLGNGEVLDLFQFSTDIGHQSVIKVKPNNLLEVAAANSLMRLMAEGGQEQPIDTFVRYKNNIKLWYEEMSNFKLSNGEIELLEFYLKQLSGVADTQEVVMRMSMDKNISGFDVPWANKLRKAIAKRSKSALDETKNEYYKRGEEAGTSKALLDYVWDVQIKRMLGYAFSILHTIGYSIIAMQELNLNLKYDPLYWQTACLTVNSGGVDSDEEDAKKQSTNYGKVASAIGNMRYQGVKVALPDINKARFGFSPDIINKQIIYGLKGLVGIGDDAVHSIIEKRPYTSFDDFLNKVYHNKILQKGQIIQLIKAGCFDNFDERETVLNRFIIDITETKEKALNMQNFPSLLSKSLIPDEYYIMTRFFRFRKHISKNVYAKVEGPKDKLLLLDKQSTDFFSEHFNDEHIVDMIDNQLIISENSFNKEYKSKTQSMRDWVGSSEALELLNSALLEENFNKYRTGTISRWEMDSLSFYYHEHELAHVNREKYGIGNFYEMNETPQVERTYTNKRGREVKQWRTTRIVGTVLDKDKNKNTISLLTPEGVVIVKYYGNFSYYDRQISEKISADKSQVVEKSWFGRGKMLMVSGFRRGNKFFPRSYRDSIFSHSTVQIEDIKENGDLSLKLEREYV